MIIHVRFPNEGFRRKTEEDTRNKRLRLYFEGVRSGGMREKGVE